MNHDLKKEVTIKIHFKEDGIDVQEIIKDAILSYVESEVTKLCCQTF